MRIGCFSETLYHKDWVWVSPGLGESLRNAPYKPARLALCSGGSLTRLQLHNSQSLRPCPGVWWVIESPQTRLAQTLLYAYLGRKSREVMGYSRHRCKLCMRTSDRKDISWRYTAPLILVLIYFVVLGERSLAPFPYPTITQLFPLEFKINGQVKHHLWRHIRVIHKYRCKKDKKEEERKEGKEGRREGGKLEIWNMIYNSHPTL